MPGRGKIGNPLFETACGGSSPQHIGVRAGLAPGCSPILRPDIVDLVENIVTRDAQLLHGDDRLERIARDHGRASVHPAGLAVITAEKDFVVNAHQDFLGRSQT